jgi:ankyrin repeat protein
MSDNGAAIQTSAELRDPFYLYVSAYWPRHCREGAEILTFEALLPAVDASCTSIHQAIRRQRYDDLRALIARKLNLDLADPEGYTAVHEAVRLQDVTALQILVLAGASLGDADCRGDTPLHTAAASNNGEILQTLLRGGGQRNQRNRRRMTPLHIAVHHGHHGAVRTLVSMGADLNALDWRDNTALHFACLTCQSRICDILIQQGSGIEVANLDGDRPLHYAAHCPHRRIVHPLLLKGADNDAKNAAGRVASEEALLQGHKTWATKIETNWSGGPEPLRTVPQSAVEFPQIDFAPGHFCRHCKISDWLHVSHTHAKRAYFTHWPSLRALHSSAKDGCEMCALFVKELDHGGQYPPREWDDLAIGVEVSFASASEGFDDRGKDTLGFFVGGYLMFLLEFCIDRRCEIPQLRDTLSGRTIQRHSESAECFSLLDEWMNNCHSEHQHGFANEPPATIPKRLVDITSGQEGNGVRVLTFQELESSAGLPFAYLSYTWETKERHVERYWAAAIC